MIINNEEVEFCKDIVNSLCLDVEGYLHHDKGNMSEQLRRELNAIKDKLFEIIVHLSNVESHLEEESKNV